MPTIAEGPEREPHEPNVGNREDWDIIEAALGFKDFDPQRRKALCRRLRFIVDNFYPRLGKRMHEVRSSHFKAALAVLRNHADRLRCYLGPELDESWPTDELEELEDLALGMFLCDHYTVVPRPKRSELIDRLKELIGLIDSALQSLPEDRGGRPRNDPLRGVIYHLADLYREHTGKPPGISWNNYEPPKYHGPFLRLIKTVLRVFVPKECKDDNALGADIKRVLKLWRKARSAMDKTSACKN